MRWCLELVPQAMLVIDPYCGSGSVCIAAKELGLPYIGIEIDAAYCEVTRNRLGQTAKLVA
jgi:site-specific DNA-methyltransferase (adenine-specific)